MASKRQIDVGGVKIGGGAPVAVQSMTKTETADYEATMRQIHAVAEAGGDLVRCAVPRDQDAEALKRLVAESPIPIIADIHFNYTLALKAIDAGAHCIRLNPGNIGGPDKVAQVAEKAKAAGVPMRIGVNSGSRPKHLHELERENSVEALVTAAVEFVELMERLDFTDFKVSVKSTSVPNTIASNRLLAERIDYPIHLGITEAGTKWSGSLKSAVGLGALLADGVGDTIRISLSTFHAEEEVKVAWEILKALKLRQRGPELIACPTCGRLQFDMDTVVAEIEQRLEGYDEPIEVAVLGCAVNGIGEASHGLGAACALFLARLEWQAKKIQLGIARRRPVALQRTTSHDLLDRCGDDRIELRPGAASYLRKSLLGGHRRGVRTRCGHRVE